MDDHILTYKSTVLNFFKRAMCIKGLFWPPLEPKTISCFSPISSDGFIRRLAQVHNSGICFTFIVAMVTKMANQNSLKQTNCHFGPNLRLLETYFLRIRYHQHKQIPKKPFNMLCAVIIRII